MLGQSTVTDADQFETAFSYRIFPNPANEFVFFEASSKIKSIAIYKSNGICIFLKDNIYAFSTKLDVSGYSTGIYIVRLKIEGNQIFSSRLIIR